MEKAENLKKRFINVLSTTKSKYIVGTIILSGIGITLPGIFHVLAGSSIGAMLLPMHIAILIAALTFGVTSSSIVAGSSIIGGYLLTRMPSVERLPYMFIELLIYAVLLGCLSKKYNSYVSLITTIIFGRILYMGVLFISNNLLGFDLNGVMGVVEAAVTGIYGIVLQLLFVPFLSACLKKGIRLDDN